MAWSTPATAPPCSTGNAEPPVRQERVTAAEQILTYVCEVRASVAGSPQPRHQRAPTSAVPDQSSTLPVCSNAAWTNEDVGARQQFPSAAGPMHAGMRVDVGKGVVEADSAAVSVTPCP